MVVAFPVEDMADMEEKIDINWRRRKRGGKEGRKGREGTKRKGPCRARMAGPRCEVLALTVTGRLQWSMVDLEDEELDSQHMRERRIQG